MTTTTTPAPTADTVATLDPVFAQMAAATVAHCWAIPQLTDREKVFLSLVADVCQPTLGLPFELHVRNGLKRGVSTADIRALLRFIAYDTGYPAALAALVRLVEIESAVGLSPVEDEPMAAELLTTGPGAAPTPLPESVRAILHDLDPHYAEYFDLQSRMRSGKEVGVLSERERGFATMSIDVHYQTLGATFRIHANRSRRAGASVEDVRAVLRFNAQFGATRAWQAWEALNTFLE